MKGKVRCLVVDDEIFARQGVIEYINDTEFLEYVSEAENPIEAIQKIKEFQIDLMFLDINMPKMSGIDFLKVSKDLPLTIITTAYPQFAIDGYELDIIDYLIKPFSYERFLKASNKAFSFLNREKVSSSNDSIFVKSNGLYEQILISDIQVIESLQNYVKIYTSNSHYIAYLTLKNVEEYFSNYEFIKIHKSFVIAKSAIQNISAESVTVNNRTFPIGNTFKSTVFDVFIKSKLLKRDK